MLIPLSISWDLANNETVADFIEGDMSHEEMIEWYEVKNPETDISKLMKCWQHNV